MTKVFKFSIFLFILTLSGCIFQNPSPDEIVGVWQSDDNAVINFYDDGTFYAKNLNSDKVFSSRKIIDDYLNVSGKWSLNGEQDSWYLDLQFLDNKKIYGSPLQIRGSGILEINPPWHLFFWIGDPDQFNTYDFYKICDSPKNCEVLQQDSILIQK